MCVWLVIMLFTLALAAGGLDQLLMGAWPSQTAASPGMAALQWRWRWKAPWTGGCAAAAALSETLEAHSLPALQQPVYAASLE